MKPTVEELIGLIPELSGRNFVVTALTGGLTNSNYKLECGNQRYVLRVPGEKTVLLGIDRVCEHACAAAAAKIGVGPEVIAFVPEQELLVTRFLDGKVITPEDSRQPDEMRRIVDALRRYHESPPGKGRFCVFNGVRSYHELAGQHGVAFPARLNHALEILEQIEKDVVRDQHLFPCHNDLLTANFIDDGISMHIIDWEFGGMGDRFFDLGNLAANHLYEEEQERALLQLYFGQTHDDDLRRVRLMRLASDMRETMWGFLQSGISSLDIDYLGYANNHLDRFLCGAERLELVVSI